LRSWARRDDIVTESGDRPYTGRPWLVRLVIALYGLGLIAFTLFPLPASPADACVGGGRQSRLFSLVTFDEGWQTAHSLGLSFLTSASFLQVLFNVLLFVPLGLLLGWRTRWPFAVVVVAGLAVSLLIELTQGTGVWGLYDCAYRYADLEDLVANALGAMIGGLIGRHLVQRAANSA